MDTRQEILTTARNLFSQSGYEAVGIQQICSSAGITKPSLYYHFGNKETLLAEVTHDAASGFLEALVHGPVTRNGSAGEAGDTDGDDDHAQDRIVFSGDLVSDIRGLFATVLRFSREHPSRFQIILQMLYPPQGSVLSHLAAPELNRIHAALISFFTLAAGAHGNLTRKEHFLAIVFVGHAIALAMFPSHTAPTPIADSPEVVQAAQTFLYGIF